ncbi:MAG: hypothetical protein ACOYB2_03055 [Limnohabitans sp.]
MKAHEWIDRLKVTKGLPSDYAVAKEIGLTRAAISNYRARNSTLDDDAALKVAVLLEIDPMLILADQATERSKDESVQSVWRTMLAQLLSKEKAPHMAGLGLITGGNGGIRTLDEALHPILP